MKYFATLIILIFTATTIQAQSNKFLSAFNNVTEYQSTEEKDTDLLLEALEAINETTLHETMKEKGKTWYYKGLINHLIFENQEISSQHPAAVFEAVASYKKALSMDDSKFRNEKEAENNLFNLSVHLYNAGVQLYTMNDYDNAYKHFNEVKQIKEFFEARGSEKKVDDTDATYNAALSLFKLGKGEEAKAILLELIDKEYDSPAIYQILASFYTDEGDNEKGLEILGKGIERYPANIALLIDELNIYLKEDREAEAIEKMENAATIDSTNAQIYYALGVAYDGVKDFDKSEVAYLKAVELDSVYYNAWNNLGALFFNQGIEINNELADNMKLTDSQYKSMTNERNALYEKALPHFETAYSLQDDELAILQALKEIYARLEMYDKSKAMKAKMQEVKEN